MPKIIELTAPSDPANTVKQWANKVIADVKRCGGRVAETTIDTDPNGTYTITIEHNLGAVPDLHETKHVKVLAAKHYEGQYMWDADCYIKPCTCIEVEVVKA